MQLSEGQEKVTITFDDGTSMTFDKPHQASGPVDAPTGADCESCGACCVESGYVGVTSDDPTPRALTRSTNGLRISEATLDDLGPRCMRREPGGRCMALQGTVGVKVACGIYDRRPAVCRRFEPGSRDCLRARDVMRYAIAKGRTRRGYQEEAIA